MSKAKLIVKSVLKFYRRYKLLTVLLFVAIFVVIKFSNIQTIEFVPNIIKNVFLKPLEDSAGYYFFDLLNALSLAYISSFIFFVIVDYIPNIKKENIANSIIINDLKDLYTNLESLIYIFLLNANIYEDCSKLQASDLIQIEKASNGNTIYFKKESLKTKTVTYEFYNLNEDVKCSINNIKNNISKIKDIAIIREVSVELVDLLSIIESNRFLSQAIDFIKLGNMINAVPLQRTNFIENFFELIKVYKKLRESLSYTEDFVRKPIENLELMEFKMFINSNQVDKEIVENIKYDKIYLGNKRIK